MQRSNPLIAQRYKSKRWQRTRRAYALSINNLCERCLKKEIRNPLYIVHHKDYIDESNYMDDEVFFNWDNLEGLCLDCHNKEHFKEEAGYIFDENGDLISND